MSDCLTVCLISCLVYARLHVNARTRAVRQTLRQIRNVAMKGGGYSDTPPQEPERQLPDARRTSIASRHRRYQTAARALGLGRSTAYELARRDELPCRVLRIGTSYRIPTADLLRVLEGI